MTLTYASLETGFGGFDLAAEQEGYTNVFQCEIDPFCTRLLKYHFPNADHYGDIRDFNATKYRGRINVLTAGFPCQPFSVAGTQKGVDDERFIWPENLRIIRECKPDWVILENVAGIFGVSEPTCIAQMENEAAFLFHQETQQETIHERVIKRIIDDLHQAGYVLPQDTKGTPIIFVVPACAVNAPHRRDRMFIVANRDGFGCNKRSNNWEKRPIQNNEIGNAEKNKRQRYGRKCRPCETRTIAKPIITDTNQIRCNGRSSRTQRERHEKSRCRIFGKPKRLCQCSDTTNAQGRNDSQHIGGKKERQKQQPRKPIIENSIANRNRRFSQQPKRKIQARWQTFINGREWIATHAQCQRRREIHNKVESKQPKRFGLDSDSKSNVFDTKSKGLQRKCFGKFYDSKEWKIKDRFKQFASDDGRNFIATEWTNFPTQPPICGGNDGLPTELDNITFPKWRAESIKGYGNAVVVPLVRVLLKTIKQVYQHENAFNI